VSLAKPLPEVSDDQHSTVKVPAEPLAPLLNAIRVTELYPWVSTSVPVVSVFDETAVSSNVPVIFTLELDSLVGIVFSSYAYHVSKKKKKISPGPKPG